MIGLTPLTIWVTSQWIGSYTQPDRYTLSRFLDYPHAQNDVRIAGGIGVHEVLQEFDSEIVREFAIWWSRYRVEFRPHAFPQYRPCWQKAGIRYCVYANIVSGDRQSVVVFKYGFIIIPAPIAILLIAGYPLVSLVRGQERRMIRRRRGLCVKCGYNLTGAPQPRCPECGTAT